MLCKRTDPSLQHAAKRIPRPLSSPISEKGTGCHFKHLIASQGETLKQAKENTLATYAFACTPTKKDRDPKENHIIRTCTI